MLCFLLNISIHTLFKSRFYFDDYRMATLYRFPVIPKAGWEHFQLRVAVHVISGVKTDSLDNHTNALIFDDLFYRRAGNDRGTRLCGKMYDHNDRRLRGKCRTMTAAWPNGELTIPFGQTLLTSSRPEFKVGNFEMPDG